MGRLTWRTMLEFLQTSEAQLVLWTLCGAALCAIAVYAVKRFRDRTGDDQPMLRAQSMQHLIARLAEGSIRPLIHGRLALKDARRAHEMLESREVIGKLLLKP